MTEHDIADGFPWDYYAHGREQDRLAADAWGELELERTTEILARALPSPPAVIADIGGGPGRYALWLAGLGYEVEHRDLVPLHVSQLAQTGAGSPAIRTAVGDARDLDLADSSVAAVLLLGPLYHLRRRADRVRALAQARRVVRPGGTVFAAAISRWGARLGGELRARLYEVSPAIRDVAEQAERTGWMPAFRPTSFAAFCHRPGQLRAEVAAAGLVLTDLVSVEGPGSLLTDLEARRADPVAWEVVLAAARATERAPELLGIGPHLLVTAIRPRD